MDLNSREQALLIWIGICLVAVLLSKGIRPALFNVLRALLQRKIVDVIGLAILYTAGCVWLLARVGIWNWHNFKTVVLWFLTTAFVSMANTKVLERGPAALGSLAREALTITAIVAFIGGVNTLPLWAELLLLPLLSLIAGMAALAEHQPEHRIVLGPLNAILTLAGFYILGYSIYRVVMDWQKLDPAFQAREFAIPIALTVMFLPYLYGLMVYMGFEQAAIRLRFKVEDATLRRYTWLRGALAFGLHPEMFGRYIQAIQMSDVSDRDGVARVVAMMCRARKRERLRPPVSWDEGWSPDDARDYLANRDLRTRPYHPTMVDWSADSPFLNLSDDVLPDHLTYRIGGTETAATELELELDARVGPLPIESDHRFWTIACDLIAQALGDETAERFQQAIPTDETLTVPAGRFTVRLSRDDWTAGKRSGYSRTLSIRHPAYKSPFSDLK